MKNVELIRLISLKLQLVRQGVGIYVSETGVYAAHVSRTITSVVVTKLAYEPFPSEIEEYAGNKRLELISETVKKCCRTLKIKKTFPVISSLSPANVVTRYFQTPVIDKKDQKEAIRYEGARFVPYRLDETIFGYFAKEVPEKKTMEIVFSAIRIDELRRHVKSVEDGGVRLLDTESPFHALARIVRSQTKDKTSALIFNFSKSGHIAQVLLKDQVFYVCRDFYISPDDPNLLNRFFAELNSSLEYFKKQTEESALPKIYLAGDWDLDVWKGHLESYFQEGISIEKVKFQAKDNALAEESSAYAIPIGLALRALGSGVQDSDISWLETGAVAEERRAPRKWTGFVTLSLLLAGVAYYFGYFKPEMNQLNNTLTSANQRVDYLTAASPEFALQSVSQLEGRLQSLKAKNQLVQTFQQSRSFLGEKLLILSQTTSSAIWFSNLTYEESLSSGAQLAMGKRQLSLNGFVYYKEIPEEELKHIDEYVAGLKKNQEFMRGFQSLKMDGVERVVNAGRSFTKFKILCTNE